MHTNTIQNEDGSKWCTFYVESWMEVGGLTPTYKGSCIYSSSNTSDVFPEGSTCWCIWCKEYYDSLITQIGGGGNTVKVSQLEWDTNLVIPDGYLLSTPNITLAGHPLNVITRSVSSKNLVVGENVLPIVTSATKIQVYIRYRSSESSISEELNLIFTATDAVGTSRVIKNYSITVKGVTTRTDSFDFNVPIGTVKVNVEKFEGEHVILYDLEMMILSYTTSYVY